MNISTSILDATDKIKSVITLNNTNTKYIHIDIMDGKFVPNKAFCNLEEILAINNNTQKKLNIHLMVENPLEYIENLKNLNIGFIIFHVEIISDVHEVISKIKSYGYKVGLALKPDTEIFRLEPFLSEIDMVLVMSVEPGKGGQKFIPSTVSKIKEIKKIISNQSKSILISVDGGINDQTISLLEEIDIAVSGSYIVKSDNYSLKIEKLIANYNKKSFRL